MAGINSLFNFEDWRLSTPDLIQQVKIDMSA